MSAAKPPVETVLQANFKTPGGTLINLYADGTDHLTSLLNGVAALATLIQSVENVLAGSPQQAAPAAPAPAPAPVAAPAPAALPQQGGPVAPPTTDAPETDRWGNLWWYDHPSAPPLPDGSGVYALAQKQKRDKSGTYKVWVDPLKGPRPYPQNRAEFKLPDGQQWFRG